MECLNREKISFKISNKLRADQFEKLHEKYLSSTILKEYNLHCSKKTTKQSSPSRNQIHIPIYQRMQG